MVTQPVHSITLRESVISPLYHSPYAHYQNGANMNHLLGNAHSIYFSSCHETRSNWAELSCGYRTVFERVHLSNVLPYFWAHSIYECGPSSSLAPAAYGQPTPGRIEHATRMVEHTLNVSLDISESFLLFKFQ